ncbi:hypothetical protein [Spirochaeta lutea]|uniref:hypothetical protein n=1 Tax=Spirochaeta lutea TaxID=1480694 RepID=UPI0012E0350D|nr:hypothetical protein [Spirochaeta lutea]
MKRLLVLPLIYIFSWALITALGVGLSLSLLAATTSPQALNAVPFVYRLHALSVLPTAGLAGFAGAWIFSMWLLKRWGRPVVPGLIILFLLSVAGLTFGSMGLAGLFRGFDESGIPGVGHGVEPGRVETYPQGFFITRKADPLLLQDVYYRHRGMPGQIVGQVYYDTQAEELIFPDRTLAVTEITSSARGRVDTPPVLAALAEWGRDVSGVFLLYGRELSVRLAVLALALSLFALGGWTLQRARAWPFLAPFYGLLQFGAGLFVLQLFQRQAVQELVMAFVQFRGLAYLGPGLLALAGIVMLVLGVFLPGDPQEGAAEPRRKRRANA